ncbi:MAG: SemiSWEET family transporter [Methanolinea sp.]|nr:SemiSWEET family transporter [Methanolinea sp.]
MNSWFFMGVVAALLTTFGFVPQILKMYRTRHVKDVSPLTFIQFLAGVGLWALYGMHIGDPIVTVANIVTFGTLVIALLLYVHFRGCSGNGCKSV